MDVKEGDVVLIEILKKEKLATLVYVDRKNEKIGVKLIDPLVSGLNANLSTMGGNQQGLMLSMHRIKKIMNATDLLHHLTLNQHEIKKAQRQQSNLLSILSNQQNAKTKEAKIIKDINKECIIRGIKVKIINDDNEDKENDDDMNITKIYENGSDNNYKLDQDIEINNGESQRFELNDFEFLQTLGIGGCAKVKLVEHKMSQQCFAMKIHEKSSIIETKQKSHIIWEQHLLSKVLQHPFIMELIDYFENDRNLYWLLELVNGGDLFSLIRDRKRLSLESTQFFSAQIVYTFKYLHQEKMIIFRDLKPENILIDKFGYIKIGDFGIAKELKYDQDNDKQKIEPTTMTLCGTPEYLAPELLIGRGYSFSIDWWAFGILCYEMLCGVTPFMSDKSINIYNQIITEKVIFKKKLKIDNGAQKFIKQLLIKRPNKRLKNADLIMDHEFYSNINWNHIENKTMKNVPFIPDILNDKDTRYFDEYDEESDDQQEMQNW